MASRALAPDPLPPSTFARAAELATERYTVSPWVTTKLIRETHDIDLGLRAGIKVRFTPDDRLEQPRDLIAVADTIKRIETLPPNWDSYGARQLSDDAVSPAIELAITSLRRCASPHVVLLPDGGLGLRYESKTASLEIDVEPDGLATAVLEDDAGINEVDQPVPASELTDMIHRFCASI